jgi:WD40 repeat protein
MIRPWDTVNEQPTASLSRADLIEQAEASVVRINYSGEAGSGHGSGFVVDSSGLIVTNHHVISQAQEAQVVFRDGSIAEVLGVVAVSRDADVALIRIESNGLELVALPTANAVPRKGEVVLALGSPKGLDFSVTEGSVSGIRKPSEISEIAPRIGERAGTETTWIQTTAPISSGNSGGPLLNMNGEVVGVNTWTLSSGQNLNFAVSVEAVRSLLGRSGESITTLAEANDPSPSTAKVQPSEPELAAELVSQTKPGLLHTFSDHKSAVQDVAVSRDGRFLATAGVDQSAWIYSLQTLKCEQRLELPGSSFETVCFSADGQQVYTGLGPAEPDQRNFLIWNRKSGELQHRLLGREIAMRSIAASPDGNYALSSYGAGLVELRSFEKPNDTNFLQCHDKSTACWDASFSPDSRLVLTAGGDGYVFIWTVYPAPVSRMKVHDNSVRVARFSPDGTHVLTGGGGKSLRLWTDWKIQDHWKELRGFSGHDAEVTSADFSSSGTMLVSGDSNGRVIVWDVRESSPLYTFEDHAESITKVRFLPSGRFVVSSSKDGTARLWNVPKLSP